MRGLAAFLAALAAAAVVFGGAATALGAADTPAGRTTMADDYEWTFPKP
jgi:hypothetical protein